MAQKTLVQLVDDLDGSVAEETVSFGLDGNSYQIDLSGAHAEALRAALSSYIVAARRASGPGRRQPGRPDSAGSGSTSGSDRQRTAEIRQWARERGLEVNDRGRVPSRVLEAYEAAH